METLNTSLKIGTVRAWEECIWLDRRENCDGLASRGHGRLARFGAWLRRQRARAQLGPISDEGEWSVGDPEKRF